MNRGRHGGSLADRAARSGVLPSPPADGPPPPAADRRPPATAARAGTAGCATRRRPPGAWPGLLVEWRQRGGSWQGRVAYTVAGPHGPALVEAWLPAARLEPR